MAHTPAASLSAHWLCLEDGAGYNLMLAFDFDVAIHVRSFHLPVLISHFLLTAYIRGPFVCVSSVLLFILAINHSH